MKKTVSTLIALAAFSASALFVQAQPAAKILVVDLSKLYDGHYKTEEQNAKLRGDEQKAQEELERLNKEGATLVDQYKDLSEQSKNPALTTDARGKAEADSQKKMEEIQRKQNEVASFRQNTQRSLQQRIKTFRDLMLEEISKIATDIAKEKGATILLDKSGPTLIGVSNFIYTDPAYDITDDVMKAINKDRPPAPAAGVGSATASPDQTPTTPPASSDSPTITVPGVPKK
jgi:outer membrane protein